VKKCNRCGETKALERFRCDANRPDGHRAVCKTCASVSDKVYRDNNYSSERKAEIARRYREKNPESLTRQRKDYRSKNPEKDRANNIINKAVASGRMTRPSTCSWCGSAGRIEGAHVDYADPYLVVWLCPKCHREMDKAAVA
jgi:hypothetical protein